MAQPIVKFDPKLPVLEDTGMRQVRPKGKK